MKQKIGDKPNAYRGAAATFAENENRKPQMHAGICAFCRLSGLFIRRSQLESKAKHTGTIASRSQFER